MKYFILITLLLPLIAFSAEESSWYNFQPFGTDSFLKQTVFLEGTAKQHFFKYKSKYPNTDVVDFYSNVLKSSWVKCKPIGKWESFGSQMHGTNEHIHQLLQHWINPKTKSALMLSVRYHSKSDKCDKEPDNDIQHVILVEYKAPAADYFPEYLKLQCNAT